MAPELAPMIDRLAAFPGTLAAAVGGVTPADARWRPDERSWAIVEIITHIADEETEDFGRRTRLTLESQSPVWPSIDPEGWAAERAYIDRDVRTELERFAAARAASVAWLRTLPADAPWPNEYTHPSIGTLRAGDVFASWCAHDVLHLRQIAKRLYQLTVRDAGPYDASYAGNWTA